MRSSYSSGQIVNILANALSFTQSVLLFTLTETRHNNPVLTARLKLAQNKHPKPMKPAFRAHAVWPTLAPLLLCPALQAQPLIEPLTSPPELRRYETQLFNLVERSEKASFDFHVRKAFIGLLRKAPVSDPALERKLLSGPAAKGRYIDVGGNRYFYFSACQAHLCSTTRLEMLFDPNTRQALGALNYKCAVHYLNLAGESQKRWFEEINAHRLDQRLQKELCEEANLDLRKKT